MEWQQVKAFSPWAHRQRHERDELFKSKWMIGQNFEETEEWQQLEGLTLDPLPAPPPPAAATACPAPTAASPAPLRPWTSGKETQCT